MLSAGPGRVKPVYAGRRRYCPCLATGQPIFRRFAAQGPARDRKPAAGARSAGCHPQARPVRASAW